jgi:hypothetical protein
LGNLKRRSFGRPKDKWKGNIRIDVREIGCEFEHFEHVNKRSCSIKCGEFLDGVRDCLLDREHCDPWR